MKILYCSLHPDLNLAAPSGPGTHMREVIKAFENEGHEVVKYIAGGVELADHGAPIHFRRNTLRRFVPKWFWLTLKDLFLWRRDLIQRRFVRDFIEQEKPDLIYERINYLSTAVGVVAHEKGIPHFAEFNAPYPLERKMLEGSSLTSFLARRAERKQVQLATRSFTVSSVLKDYLLKKSGVVSDRIVVTPNAVNPGQFVPDAEASGRLRSQLGIADHDVVIGFVGSIFPYHGVDLLIHGFIEATKKGRSNMKLLIVGDGETLPTLRSEVDALGMNEQIIFTGNVPYKQIATYLGAMDIAVMAKSDWYMSPVKIFEYGLMNKAIIAQSTSPVRDVMEHGVHAYLVEATSVSIQKGIEYLLDHPDDARRMAQVFHDKVLKEHTWDAVGRLILKEYR